MVLYEWPSHSLQIKGVFNGLQLTNIRELKS